MSKKYRESDEDFPDCDTKTPWFDKLRARIKKEWVLSLGTLAWVFFLSLAHIVPCSIITGILGLSSLITLVVMVIGDASAEEDTVEGSVKLLIITIPSLIASSAILSMVHL